MATEIQWRILSQTNLHDDGDTWRLLSPHRSHDNRHFARAEIVAPGSHENAVSLEDVIPTSWPVPIVDMIASKIGR